MYNENYFEDIDSDNVENTDDFFKVTKVSKVLPGLGIVALDTKKCKIINYIARSS